MLLCLDGAGRPPKAKSYVLAGCPSMEPRRAEARVTRGLEVLCRENPERSDRRKKEAYSSGVDELRSSKAKSLMLTAE
jgi:hypothetical protein